MRIGGQLSFTRRTKAAAQVRARLLASPADAGIYQLEHAAAETSRGMQKRVNHRNTHNNASRFPIRK